MNPSHALSQEIEFSSLNEADVRAELVDPLLRDLGYKAGTHNNIVRDHTFRYDRQFLGRKKPSDPQLAGKPDYILEVGTIGRWLLEAKAPGIALGAEAFEQAQSYALHPSVSASLVVLCNGRQFKVYRQNARGADDTLVEFAFDNAKHHWPQLFSYLSPEGFARNVPQVRWDPRRPVAVGYGASLEIVRGLATPINARSSIELPPEAMRMLANLNNPLPFGSCERGMDGKLKINVGFGTATSFMDETLRQKGLDRISLTTQDEDVSTDPDQPTLFTGEFDLVAEEGELFYDLTTWEPGSLPTRVESYSRIDALGVLVAHKISGTYSLRMCMKVLGLSIDVEQLGEFEIHVR